jgi:hypothetical protein
VGCVFSREVWFLVLGHCDWLPLIPVVDDLIGDWWLRARERVSHVHRPVFDSLIALVTHCLWLECNARLFQATSSTNIQLAGSIGRHIDDWCNAKLFSMSLLF